MLRTTNYDLCQYQGSDKTSYLVNYNEDMLKIDTAIKAAKDAADLAQTTANGADGKADSVAGDVSTLNTQINGPSGIAADLVTAQGAINTINSLIGTGEPTTTDKTIIGAINELAAEMPSPVTSLAASAITYDNITSGLTADDVQEAIDEIVAAIPSSSGRTLRASSTSLTFGGAAGDLATAFDSLSDIEKMNAIVLITTSNGSKNVYSAVDIVHKIFSFATADSTRVLVNSVDMDNSKVYVSISGTITDASSEVATEGQFKLYA